MRKTARWVLPVIFLLGHGLLLGQSNPPVRHTISEDFHSPPVHTTTGSLGPMTAAAASSDVLYPSPYVSDTQGPQKTLVMLINFTDDRSEPVSVAQVKAVMADVNGYYKANSYGMVSLQTDVVGWLQMPTDSATFCSYVWGWRQAANDLALAAGYDVARYPRRVYIPTRNDLCGWCGNATVGDSPSVSWIRSDCVATGVIAHELGHNFGAYHSHSESCDTVSGTLQCAKDEYGDPYDVMGNPDSVLAGPSAGQMNAFQKRRLGWLDYKSAPKTQTIVASGRWTLSAYDSPHGNLKALFWQEPALACAPECGSRGYYVEYRPSIGVLIHTGGRWPFSPTPDDSLLKDLDDSTPATDWVLDAGQTWDSWPSDSPGITVTSLGSGQVEVVLR